MRLVIFSFLTSITLSVYSQEAAAAYMNLIDQTVQNSTKKLNEYINGVLKHESFKRLDKSLSELKSDIVEGTTELKKIKGFQGDKGFIIGAKKYLTALDSLLNEGYTKLKDQEAEAKNDVVRMKNLLTSTQKANQQLASIYERYLQDKFSFAEKYKVNALKNEENLASLIKKNKEVFQYYNKIYLHFFTCELIEKQILLSINSEDQRKLDSLIITFEDSTNHKFKLIEQAASYKGNRDLVIVTKKVVDFYRSEVPSFKKMSEFIKLKKRLTELKAKIDQKEASDAEKKEFNEGVDKINSLAAEVNQNTQKYNKMRTSQIDEWNQRSDSFIDKYL